MIDVEERLRHSLTRHADAAPRGDRMLSRVRRESGRRRRNRRVALAFGTATIVALGTLGATAIAGPVGSWKQDSPTGTGPQVPEINFVAGAPVDVTFPFTAAASDLIGDTPPMLTLVAGRPTLQLETAAANSVTVTVGDSTWAAEESDRLTGGHEISVRGHVGTIADRRNGAGPAQRVLSWPEQPDQWVEIDAPPSTTTTAMTRYAEALANQPMTQPAPFEFDLLPSGLIVDNLDASTVTFHLPGTTASADFDGKLAVLFDDNQATAQDGRLVTVAGRTARIQTQDDVTTVRIDDGAGHSIVIQAPTALRVAQTDLLRFAAGIYPTAGATPAKG